MMSFKPISENETNVNKYFHKVVSISPDTIFRFTMSLVVVNFNLHKISSSVIL